MNSYCIMLKVGCNYYSILNRVITWKSALSCYATLCKKYPDEEFTIFQYKGGVAI